ncbi:MAG TPA: hypothetical protein VGG10_17755 [Rhizomicrobium sp.]
MTRLSFLVVAFLATAVPAFAASVSVSLSDTHGAPAASAVVTLVPASAGAPVTSHVPEEAIIDQRHQMFLPLVVVVRQGGHVVFTNNDDTRHQVYSFSPIKQFQFEIEQGRKSEPVMFPKAGVAAIGCNIHDNMLAYVFVSDAPETIITDAKGTATLANITPGTYHATIWHPRFMPGQLVTMDVVVTASGATITRSLPLMADKMSDMHRQHMQSY